MHVCVHMCMRNVCYEVKRNLKYKHIKYRQFSSFELTVVKVFPSFVVSLHLPSTVCVGHCLFEGNCSIIRGPCVNE